MSLLFKQFQDYIEGLAAAHVDLLHSEENHVFCQYQSDDQVNRLKTTAAENAVIVGAFYGRAKGGHDDNRLMQYASLFFVAYARVGTGDPSAEIEAALQRSMAIMLDFWARIKNDSEEDSCGPLRGLRPEEMTFDPIEDQPILENHYGWEMTLPFVVNAPAFNPAKWNADGN